MEGVTDKENKGNGSSAKRFTVARGLREPQQDCDDQKANELPECRQDHQPAPTHALHQQYRKACKDHVGYGVASGQKTGGAFVQLHGLGHDGWKIVAHDVNTAELLHELASCAEE